MECCGSILIALVLIGFMKLFSPPKRKDDIYIYEDDIRAREIEETEEEFDGTYKRKWKRYYKD